jgi:replicative DNA helicase
MYLRLKNAAAGRIKNILNNEELYNAESYEVDPAVQYLDFLRNNLKPEDFIDPETDKKNVRYMAMKALEYTVNGEMQKDELVKRLISYEEGIKNLIGSKYQGTPADVYNKTLTDPEFQQLARTVIALTDGKIIS